MGRKEVQYCTCYVSVCARIHVWNWYACVRIVLFVVDLVEDNDDDDDDDDNDNNVLTAPPSPPFCTH